MVENVIQVAAAVMERDGKILACRRRQDQDHPGRWEFPGGKIEPGETPAAALGRELKEELGIEASVSDEIARKRHEYAGRPAVELFFLRVVAWQGEPDYSQFAAAEWRSPSALPELDFLEGDVEFVRELAARDT